MSLLRRIWTVIMGWFGLGVASIEDPEVLLEAAKNELEEKVRRAKLDAVEAIKEKNLLGGMLAAKKAELADLTGKIEAAITQDKEELAETLAGQQIALEKTVADLQANYDRAVEVSDTVKQQIAQMEREVYAKYQEQMMLKTKWHQAKISERLNTVLSGIATDTASEAMERAKKKIEEKAARADAMLEVGETNVKRQLEEVEAEAARSAAKQRLAEIKARMQGGGQ
ncbi:MAG: PspA/IM30 family protein [Chloroflexota bacterium]